MIVGRMRRSLLRELAFRNPSRSENLRERSVTKLA
jgi:hypothetical protein